MPLSDFYQQKKDGRPYTYRRCIDCHSRDMISRHQERKIQALDYKGNKCMICGYNKCRDALVFHHRDPLAKEFGISKSKTIAWSKVRAELDKCVLLCHNCHSEVHAGLAKLP